MIRTRFAALATMAFTALAVAATPASAAPGTTQNMCASALTPSGWVDVQWWNSAGCGSGFTPNTKQVMDLNGYPVGTQVNACASTWPPAGWTIVGSYYSSGCRYSAVPSFNANTWTLKRTS
ncbi:hypothetical protein HYE82_02490 [Streptomyces sp. BR123]|uniref:hypothetical protein n=1 Tax=Streptomyces sp. BR123 TaxID=2749828 RepID=UPI0015C4D603|nr:hypothetical protein [Streptomyces sp. BR123]NXY93297.1 hypothetical protein [Streptomyces sp. BR123]